MFRLISALLVALAMFLSPVLMTTGGGAAMAHAAKVSQANEHGHCEGKGAPVEDQKTDAKMSCSSTCAAFAAVIPTMQGQAAPLKLPATSLQPVFRAGVPPEHETPPPRSNPAI